MQPLHVFSIPYSQTLRYIEAEHCLKNIHILLTLKLGVGGGEPRMRDKPSKTNGQVGLQGHSICPGYAELRENKDIDNKEVWWAGRADV